jgi:hypothetical protein
MLSLSNVVGDSMLESYSVECTKFGALRLKTVNYHREPPLAIDVVFSGVVAHHFQNVHQDSVINDIEEMAAGDLFAQIRPQAGTYLQQFYYDPDVGPAGDQDAISRFFQRYGINGYAIHSSCGLCGWVLAASIAWFELTA